jgi:hypothetical protein
MRWFVPDGIKRPAHIPAGGIVATLDGVSGVSVGGPLPPAGSVWHTARGGWLFHVEQADQPRQRIAFPQDVVTVDDGSGRQWTVTQLLLATPDGFRCALPCTWTADGFLPPECVRDLLERIAQVIDGALGDGAVPYIVCDILALSYYLSHEEVLASGWLTDRAINAIMLGTVRRE